jgi:hypothetical protein
MQVSPRLNELVSPNENSFKEFIDFLQSPCDGSTPTPVGFGRGNKQKFKLSPKSGSSLVPPVATVAKGHDISNLTNSGSKDRKNLKIGINVGVHNDENIQIVNLDYPERSDKKSKSEDTNELNESEAALAAMVALATPTSSRNTSCNPSRSSSPHPHFETSGFSTGDLSRISCSTNLSVSYNIPTPSHSQKTPAHSQYNRIISSTLDTPSNLLSHSETPFAKVDNSNSNSSTVSS